MRSWLLVCRRSVRSLVPLTGVAASACVQPDPHTHGDAAEVISTIELTFTPQAGGDPIVARFVDPDGDGGESGMSDPIVLTRDATYGLDVVLLNTLVDPPVDITEEVREEADEHLVFIYGDGVTGPASMGDDGLVRHEYADLESDYEADKVGDDLPLGLHNIVAAEQTGTSTLSVMLRHLPELNGQPQKSAELPEDFADGKSLPGDVDVNPSFDLTVE